MNEPFLMTLDQLHSCIIADLCEANWNYSVSFQGSYCAKFKWNSL